jgi:hypothetical protein
MSVSLAFEPVTRLTVRLGFPSAVWSYDIDRVLVLLSILWAHPDSLGVLLNISVAICTEVIAL